MAQILAKRPHRGLLASYITIEKTFLFVFNVVRLLVGYSSTILRYGFHNQQTHHV